MPISMQEQMRQLEARFAAKQQQIHENLDKALAEKAEQVAEDARALAPVDTGELRDSIEVVKVADLQYKVVVTAPYALDVELGTVNQAAEPFLFPALEANRADLPEELAKALKNV